MKKIAIYVVMIISSIFLFSACATILTGTKQEVSLNTNPPAAQVSVNEEDKDVAAPDQIKLPRKKPVTYAKQKVSLNTNPPGARVFVDGEDSNAITPCQIEVRRKKSVTYTFQKEGYKDGVVEQSAEFNGWVIGNAFIGGLIGGFVDYATGAWYKFPENIIYNFGAPVGTRASFDFLTKSPAGEIILEFIAIRWSFDSDLKDARIFWSVISNIPDRVKNTDELYLSVTPFDETRILNIEGLTYENSRDVTIEIKVTKEGYQDQVKYYNVRQVVDQKKIDGFFKMVKSK